MQLTRAQAPVTFAQFNERNLSQDFVFTNTVTNATFNTVSVGSAVTFVFGNIAGLNPVLQSQNAHLFLISGTTTPATSSGTDLTQSISNAGNTIVITRDTPAPLGIGSGTRTNLLTVTFSPNLGTPDITGNTVNGSTAFSAGSGNNIVTFTSDFLNFSNTNARAFAFSFSSVNPSLSIGPGGFLNSFTAAATGTFSSNPAPTVPGITAAAVSIGGRVLTPTGRGLRNAQVTLTEADGTTRTVLTGNAGSFRFNDVTIPQTVIVSVRSKSYRFTPQIISPDADFTGLDFYRSRQVKIVITQNAKSRLKIQAAFRVLSVKINS